MTDPHPPAPEPRARGLSDLSDDALGFGALELVTARDVTLRPRAVLEAWMTQGPSGGGRYARPLRLYLALNAILMLMLFLRGGSDFMLAGAPAEYLDPLIAASGKSRDAFMADADNWMSLVMVPLTSLFYAFAAAPLLRWWDPEDLGWRRGFRAAFGWLCAVTVLLLPFAWWMSGATTGPGALLGAAALFVISVATFLRMGRGRWWRSPVWGVVKGIGLWAAIQLGAGVGFLPVLAIGLLAGRFA
ncbi:MAG: hypothetical protein KKC29_01965 [Alphaproteobacteria bacterium]|jgi:hypothetical protein|nr:hypothetical protein [Alphaproteobacteria bacterium]MBU2041675.1 hypothetical protein [Alphaproteobacteria bacterium]MBU2125276.1 hypothetical protein [Alphaproteobacteria bacterium]MBU2208753.1 hypothetical protein [Alphaproteobacteria bacterium]MBU2289853.1 hypothetical protein [Alphaproteobacteria bacterium]